MQHKGLSINSISMRFIFLSLIFGFLSIGVVSAATIDNKSGTWVNKEYKIEGGWSIETRGDQQVILFNEQFNTKKGPDLKVFLSPQSIDQVNGKTATDGSVIIAALKSNNGSQEYVIPSNIDLSNFKSLLIHCEQYSVLWGGTNL